MTPELVQKRYSRLQAEIQKRNIGALLLTDPIHIRYATGTVNMALWTAFNYARYCIIPAEGEPVIWEYPEALFVAKKYWKDVRPCEYWQFRFAGAKSGEQSEKWASQIADALKQKGLDDRPLGIDRLDSYGFQALQKQALGLCDADEAMQAARMIKFPEEISLMQENVTITEKALSEMVAKIEPGISEHELLGTFWQGILSRGGEWCYTRLIASGERTNPWFQEASDKKIAAGDIVAIDTDVIGLDGYACDISRTFVCGQLPNTKQRENFKYAYEYIDKIKAELKPGVTWEQLVHAFPAVKDCYLKNRYPIFAHGLGMDDEPPFLPFADQTTSAKSEDVLEENMVICVEFYAGLEGGEDGVKIEDQLLITANGSEQMNSDRFHEHFLD
ncbi:Xaa-Pro peptidase family protein [Oligoflexaceae bacterium]|nr:Xaa-Pro peptidase family protein [Oligoflexaceae bacterium]